MLNRGWAVIRTRADLPMLRCQTYVESRMVLDKISCLFTHTHPSATSAVGRRHFALAEYERPQPGEASREQHHLLDVRGSIPSELSLALKVAAPLVACVEGLRVQPCVEGCSPARRLR